MTQAENSRNSGPAFPTTTEHGFDCGEPGMTLRDYFAAKAMQGIVSSIDGEANYQRLRGHATDAGLSVSEWIARDAFKQADAMLKARNHSVGQSENDRRVAACLDAQKQRDELLEALKMATLQNQLDMLMTGEELRKCESAISKAEAFLADTQSSAGWWDWTDDFAA